MTNNFYRMSLLWTQSCSYQQPHITATYYCRTIIFFFSLYEAQREHFFLVIILFHCVGYLKYIFDWPYYAHRTIDDYLTTTTMSDYQEIKYFGFIAFLLTRTLCFPISYLFTPNPLCAYFYVFRKTLLFVVGIISFIHHNYNLKLLKNDFFTRLAIKWTDSRFALRQTK